MSKNIVVMPTLKRPEMLALALERVSATGNDCDVHIYLDTCTSERLDEVEYIRDQYYPSALIFRAGKHVDAPSGCWNILNALKSGYDTGADRVFLIEEDVMVYPNYFDWHIGAQYADLRTVTCGRFIKRYGADYYTNPGSCWPSHILESVIPHINDDFFRDRRGYMDRVFGQWEEASDLDDGLMRRVIRSIGARITFPDEPVAVHQGYHQYGRSDMNRTFGTIQERIDQARFLLSAINPTQRYYHDFEPYDVLREARKV